MKTNATMEDVKRIWNYTTGFYFFDKEERERAWKRFQKKARKEWESPQQLYEFLCKATGLR